MKKYVVELIGTFFLVFTVGMTVIEPGAGALAPIAIGSALMVMIFSGGHISGGHFNPAVTLAATLRGALTSRDTPAYMIAQAIGAVIASFAVCYLKGPEAMHTVATATAAKTLAVGPALLAEFLFTYALCWVVLNVATARGTQGNSFYGLAIGFTVLTGAFAVGGISGGAFNPAVALGITMMGLSTWANLWVFLVANFAGAVAAATIFSFTHSDEV